MKLPRPILLIVLDGFGYREETESNAIASAYKPNWDDLWNNYPHTSILSSGQSVGLPSGQMGNSEVGHLNMGAGRIVYQDLTRIDLAIESGEFYQNQVLLQALQEAKNKKKAVHVLGLLSQGGVHSHEKHIHALLSFGAQFDIPFYIHAFLDGRDTPPKSSLSSLKALEEQCKQLKFGRIASLIGRYYAMDRDKRWERIHKAYDLIVAGLGDYRADNAIEGLELAYARNESDEFVLPTSIHKRNEESVSINDGDIVIFMNFRADRARELTQALIDPHFHGFKRDKWPLLGDFICLSEYDKNFKIPVAFPPTPLPNILGEYISVLGLKQLRIAETEKYAHVTFFFNGGIEEPFVGEDRILIPSARVATYDLKPEMSAFEMTERLIQEIKGEQYDLIICNFANADMVGHSGDFKATVKAIEAIDICLKEILNALREVGGELVITADHGNAELMFNTETNQPHTAHTSDPVPFIYVGRKAKIMTKKGKLSDIAPTLLYLLGLPKPSEMMGESLVEFV